MNVNMEQIYKMFFTFFALEYVTWLLIAFQNICVIIWLNNGTNIFPLTIL